jgi:hypothetical protein
LISLRNLALSISLLMTMGCTHTLIVVQWGIGNKSAASLAPLTPEAYCLALLSPNISFKKLPPTLTTEQKAYCEDLLLAASQQKISKPPKQP